MACPKCPNDDTQMVVAKAYGMSVCKCPDCLYQIPIQRSGEESLKKHIKENPK